MISRHKEGALTEEEKQIEKALLTQEWRNQDIQHLLNIGRKTTINIARITEVKNDNSITPASLEKVKFFKLKKQSFDNKTKLCQYDNERLVRAREAMILAVQIFNNPSIKFKTEQFSVQATIAWTYLLHEYYLKNGKNIQRPNQRSKKGKEKNISLREILKCNSTPLPEEMTNGIKNNLHAIMDIRNVVTHSLLGPADDHYFEKFQACCLNFDKILTKLFGDQVSLQHELSLALQFSKLDTEQISTVQSYGVPANIKALDLNLEDRLTDEDKADVEYQFRVIYTLAQSSKGKKHIEFIKPESAKGKEIHNVLEKRVSADALYPYKPQKAAEKIAQRSQRDFSVNNHANAWKIYEARPDSNSDNKCLTKKEYCIYHEAHHDYTYSEAWIDFIVSEIGDEQKYQKIRTRSRRK